MSDRQAVDIENLLNDDRKVTIVNCYFGRACHKLYKHVHFLLIERFYDAPKPFDHWRLY